MKDVPDLRLFVEVDMEGVSGAVYGGFDLQTPDEDRRAERLMTLETNALVQGAREAGIRHIVLSESHPFARAHLVDGCELTHGTDGLEACDLLAFVGRHARAGVPHAVRSHTGSSKSVHSLQVNGVEFGEFGLLAALAGSYGIPAVFVGGDRAAVEEARALVPEIGTAATSEGLGHHTALCATPVRAQSSIREGIRRAIGHRRHIPPLRVSEPVCVETTLAHPAQAERMTLVPGVTLKDARTATFSAPTYRDAYRLYRATSLVLIWWDVRRD